MDCFKLPNRKNLLSVLSIALIVSSLITYSIYKLNYLPIFYAIIFGLCLLLVFFTAYLIFIVFNIKIAVKNQKQSYNIIQTHRPILDALTEAIWFIDPKTHTLLDVNQTTAKLFGYNREQLLLMKIEQFSANNEIYNKERALAIIQRTNEGEKIKFEWMFRRSNGNLFTTENIIHKVTIFGTEFIVISTTDISEKIKIEASLAKKETRFKDLFQQAGEGIIICNERGMILEANEALSKISDYDYDDLIGSNITMLFKDSTIREKELNFALLNDGKALINESELIKKDGVNVHTEINVKGLPGGLVQI
ncbi:MAG TPA: hypothetical protein DCQ31_03520, partial [Bacteroidales bacterium]|nr:hypothetical protein [Bacteroidales bacterium]